MIDLVMVSFMIVNWVGALVKLMSLVEVLSSLKKAMLISGVPILNRDGVTLVEPSEVRIYIITVPI